MRDLFDFGHRVRLAFLPLDAPGTEGPPGFFLNIATIKRWYIIIKVGIDNTAIVHLFNYARGLKNTYVRKVV